MGTPIRMSAIAKILDHEISSVTQSTHMKLKVGERYTLMDSKGNSTTVLALGGDKDEVVVTPVLKRRESRLLEHSRAFITIRQALIAAGLMHFFTKK